MSTPSGSDPIDRLRAADPARSDEVSTASLARVSARIQEHVMTEFQNAPIVPRSRRPLALIGGSAIAAALALTIVIGSGLGAPALGPIGSDPAPSTDPGGGGAMASCIMYDPAMLPTFDTVFDGTVTAIEGDRVTFEVGTAWKGADGKITLTAPATSVALVGPMPDFEVGGRYLVTAAGSDVNGCGYTMVYDADTAASWAAAFAN